ncbi:MAG: TIGR02147 family protein [Fibrobacteres bacterium]|nr:TIGR02147 family protein [Fibrobacterota bacterium]
MPMEAAAVSVFAYADYRVFLKDYYERARRIDRRFSHRYISSKMGFASASWFNDLLKGRTNLAGTHLVKLAGLLKLKDTEADYLETLIQYNQANSKKKKNRYYKKLNPALKTSQAKEAISLLEKLGFIRKDAQGAFRPASAMLKKDASFKSLYAANYLKANMELGMQALEGFQKEERHISAITLSFSKPGFDKAISEIESLRKRLMVLMKEDTRPDKVFQFNVQFFPVTN